MEEKTLSFQGLLATILATGKPVIVHNGWLDLAFLYGHFYAPLPPSLGTLIADLDGMFAGGVYDTKAIAEYRAVEEASYLEFLFRMRQAQLL